MPRVQLLLVLQLLPSSEKPEHSAVGAVLGAALSQRAKGNGRAAARSDLEAALPADFARVAAPAFTARAPEVTAPTHLRQSKASIDDSVVYFSAMDIPKFNSHSLSRKSKKRRYSTGVDSEKCSLCRYLVIVAFICRSLCRSRSLFSDSTFAIKIRI